MKAVILAGGYGTRLHPLTEALPKPLVPLLGKPVLLHILDLLARHGIREACVTAGFQADLLEEALTHTSFPSLRICREERPLGTAGGVRNAARLLSPGRDEPLLVISGDAMCDLDLSAAMRFHAGSAAAATILAARVDDPREYGLLCADDTGRLLSFAEKPSYAGCLSDLANTGIYLLSSEALSRIPEGRPCDFAADLFPALLRLGLPLMAFEAPGYWRDIGDLHSYLACQWDMLDRKVSFHTADSRCPEGIFAAPPPAGEYTLRPPVRIGRDVRIGSGAVIGPYCILGDHTEIGAGACLVRSCIGDGARIGAHASLCEAVLGPGAFAGEGARLLPSCAVGPGAVIGREAIVAEGIRVAGGRRVEDGVLVQEDLATGRAHTLVLGEDGFLGNTDTELTPEVCLRIGRGLAALPPDAASLHAPVIAVGHGAKPSSSALACAVTAGILSAGGRVFSFGQCLESQFEFCLSKSEADYGVFVNAGRFAGIRITGRSGLPLSRRQERVLESAANRRPLPDRPSLPSAACPMENLSQLYLYEILRQCGASLDRIPVRVRSSSPEARRLLEEALSLLGCPDPDRQPPEDVFLIRLAADGRSAALARGNTLLPPERLLAAACLTEFFRHRSVALPASAPRCLDRLAGEFGVSLLRYREEGAEGPEPSRSPDPAAAPDAAGGPHLPKAADAGSDARRLAAQQTFLRDGLLMSVRVLSFLAETGMSLEELDARLPRFQLQSRLIPLSASGTPARAGQILSRLRAAVGGTQAETAEGLEIAFGEARAVIRPLKTGGALLLRAECTAAETAEALCDRMEDLIRAALLPAQAHRRGAAGTAPVSHGHPARD